MYGGHTTEMNPNIRGKENRFIRLESGDTVRLTVRIPDEYYERLEKIAYAHNSTLTTVGGEFLVKGLQLFEEEKEKENAQMLEKFRKRLLAIGLTEHHVNMLISDNESIDNLEAVVASLEKIKRMESSKKQ